MQKMRWHNHINHVHAPTSLRHWLTDSGSLTEKLMAHCSVFRVQRIAQQIACCWKDEFAEVGLVKVGKVHTREVILRCDDVPTIYAHTIMPLTSNASQWPLFKSLGEKSLGSTLFNDPQVQRGPLQYARLHPTHPAMQRAKSITKHDVELKDINKFNHPLFARRSLFYRRGGVMLVMELFLPSVTTLRCTLQKRTY